MLKRRVSILLITVFVLGIVLSGCGAGQGTQASSGSQSAEAAANAQSSSSVDKSAPSVNKEPVVLHTIGGPDPTGREEKLNAEFEKETGIKVVVDTVPYGQDTQKLINSFMAKDGTYDMFVMDVIELPRYVEAKWVAPIDEKVTDEMKNDLLPFAQSAIVYKGHWYGLPTFCEFKSFMYNKELLNKAGIQNPPATWDEFVTQSQQLQQKGIVKYATAWSWSQGECLTCDFVALAATFGGKFFDEQGMPTFNDKGSVDALQFMKDTIYKYKITDPASLTWSEGNVSDAMKAGDIAYELAWGLEKVRLDDSKQSKIVNQADYALMPNSGSNPHATISGPMAWSIASNSKHKEEAWKWISWKVGKEKGAKREAMEAGNSPGWKSLFQDADIVKAMPGLDKIMSQAQYAVNRPQVPWYNEFSSKLQEELQLALTQKKEPKAALDDAVKATQELIAQNK